MHNHRIEGKINITTTKKTPINYIYTAYIAKLDKRMKDLPCKRPLLSWQHSFNKKISGGLGGCNNSVL